MKGSAYQPLDTVELVTTHWTEHESIDSEDAFLALTTGDSIDVMEIFGGAGGTTKVAIRRKLKAGPIVDLVYGMDLSSYTERKKWRVYVEERKPRVLVMGPPCTHFGPFANLNWKYPSFAAGYPISEELASFAAQLAHIQLKNGRDFIAKNHATSKLWNLSCWERIRNHPRVVEVIHDQCMSGLTIPDIHKNGKPILCRKATRFVASRRCLVAALDQRCNHDKKRFPHGVIEGQWKGKNISSMAQEWPAVLCRKIVMGAERAMAEQIESESGIL